MGMRYAYVDGAFLRDRSTVAIERLFDTKPELDFDRIRRRLAVERLFYYDCVQDQPRAGESQAQFDLRTEAQRKLIADVSSAAFCHVRLGTLKQGRNRITQKEVDVKISVDMLTHAANNNIDKAVLVTGDLDFRPVIESLVQLGVIVELVYDPLVTAQELITAADVRHIIKSEDWWTYSSEAFLKGRHLPLRTGQAAPATAKVLRRGHVGSSPARLLQVDAHYIVEISDYAGKAGNYVCIQSADLTFLLEKYIPFEEGRAAAWD